MDEDDDDEEDDEEEVDARVFVGSLTRIFRY